MIIANFSNRWHRVNNVYTNGTIFIENKKTDPASYVNLTGIDVFCKNAEEINGFWAVANIQKDTATLVVDRIRSIPLFYAVECENVYISDDAKWIYSQLNNKNISAEAETEMLFFAFTLGDTTLSPIIKQVEAGNVVEIRYTEEIGYSIDKRSYFRYAFTQLFEEDKSLLVAKLDRVLENTFKRLIKYADGRQIVVSLSGGYDSRTILFMLKRLGYKNLIAYSYGDLEWDETKISRYIATRLNVPWYFVDYTTEVWKTIKKEKILENFAKYASNFASLPHIQCIAAVYCLKQQGVFEEDAIFVPGMSGDLNTGGYADRYPLLDDPQADAESLSEAILDYIGKVPTQEMDASMYNFIREHLVSCLYDKRYTDMSQRERFEAWVASEEVAKFYLNSVRTYELFGYKWWAPFWDAEYVSYWYNVPLSFRLKQKLYKEELKYNTKKLGVFNDIDPLIRDCNLHFRSAKIIGARYRLKENLRRDIAKFLKKFFPQKMVKIIHKAKSSSLYNVTRISGRYWNNFITVMYPSQEVLQLAEKGYKLNAVLAHYLLKNKQYL